MGETIRLTASDGHELGAYRADPSGTAKAGLVLIQEAFGVNRHIRADCDRYAGLGYAVIAPQLFDRVPPGGEEFGYGPDERPRRQEIRSQITWAENVIDAGAAREALKDFPNLFIVGYCMGGSVSWMSACRYDFNAAVTYYGGAIAENRNDTARCPVMMHFGEEDRGIPLSDVELVRAAQPDVIIHTYPGAGHGFNCDDRGEFNPEASETARQRTLAFFDQHMK